MAEVPELEFRKYLRLELSTLISECHAITNKNPETASVVQQVQRVVSSIENLTKCTPARVGESSQWISVVNSAEENRAKFCKLLNGKPLFSALYGMYTVTLKELQDVLKVNTQTGQNGAVNKTSLESTAQDDDF